eukprot:gene9640-10627_t
MPSSLLTDMEHGGTTTVSSLDDHRTLQLALELSMLGLDDDQHFGDLRTKKSMNMTECVPVPSSEHVAEIVGRQGIRLVTSFILFAHDETGCKIKALRAKTNTYIKTPVRGEEPVFVVTGRKEDVAMAQREIIQAAEHFSQIRASRRNSASSLTSSLGPVSPTIPGHTTKSVRVPYRVVGLVVGPKGATIKRIQQTTNTYIVTPSRDKEPVFEVTGLPDNVEKAKKEIEQHIALRTGGILENNLIENGGNGGEFNGFPSPLFSPTSHSSFSAFLDHNHTPHNNEHHRSHSADSYSGYYASSSGSSKMSDLGSAKSPFNGTGFFSNDIVPSPTADLDSPRSSAFDPAPGSPASSIWPDLNSRALQLNRAVGSQNPPLLRSSTLVENGTSHHQHLIESEQITLGQPPIRRNLSDPYNNHANAAAVASTTMTNPATSIFSPFSSSAMINGNQPDAELIYTSGALNGLSSPSIDISASGSLSDGSTGSQASSPGSNWKRSAMLDDLSNAAKKKSCIVCQTGDVVAALVPCGHNLFCIQCASKLRNENNQCPACGQKVEQILRIIPY